ncbi:MAG: hypothetical protein ABIJ85_04185 [bacterium]
MSQEQPSYQEKEELFNRFVVGEYLKYGSVDEIFRQNKYELPISYPGVHRLIKRWGIIKSAGPNSILSEGITFLSLLSKNKVPLESLYKRLPPSFKTSMGTMHRLLHNIKEGVTRRVGTALVITSDNNPDEVLVGEDVSTPRLELGKPFGSITLPMGYSKMDEDSRDSILRVLQQEVFTQMAIDRNLPLNLIPANHKPFMYVDVADIRVSVYHIELPQQLTYNNCFSSHKVRKHNFISVSELAGDNRIANFRSGIKEIGLGYRKYLEKSVEGVYIKPIVEKCLLNRELAIAFAQELA